MANDLTIVTYHYVREQNDPWFPAFEAKAFREQLAHIRRHYNPVDIAEVTAALDGEGDALPDNAILLTFDDGYLDHYTVVFPLLLDHRISGAFFAPTSAAIGRKVLDVNKLHCLRAATKGYAGLLEWTERRIDQAHAEAVTGVQPFAAYRARFSAIAATDAGARFDAPDVLFFKRMLQYMLPEAFRTALVDELFRRHVSEDESSVAAGLYATPDQLRTMHAGGMYIGPHGASHRWLDQMSADQQAADIDGSLDILATVGAPAVGFAFAYPYGGYNADTIALLKARGCALALTTKLGIADLGRDARHELPRIDCLDIPAHAGAAAH